MHIVAFGAEKLSRRWWHKINKQLIICITTGIY